MAVLLKIFGYFAPNNLKTTWMVTPLQYRRIEEDFYALNSHFPECEKQHINMYRAGSPFVRKIKPKRLCGFATRNNEKCWNVWLPSHCLQRLPGSLVKHEEQKLNPGNTMFLCISQVFWFLFHHTGMRFKWQVWQCFDCLLVPWQCALLCDHFGLAAGSVETDLFVLRQHACNRTRLAEMHPSPHFPFVSVFSLPKGMRFTDWRPRKNTWATSPNYHAKLFFVKLKQVLIVFFMSCASWTFVCLDLSEALLGRNLTACQIFSKMHLHDCRVATAEANPKKICDEVDKVFFSIIPSPGWTWVFAMISWQFITKSWKWCTYIDGKAPDDWTDSNTWTKCLHGKASICFKFLSNNNHCIVVTPIHNDNIHITHFIVVLSYYKHRFIDHYFTSTTQVTACQSSGSLEASRDFCPANDEDRSPRQTWEGAPLGFHEGRNWPCERWIRTVVNQGHTSFWWNLARWYKFSTLRTGYILVERDNCVVSLDVR